MDENFEMRGQVTFQNYRTCMQPPIPIITYTQCGAVERRLLHSDNLKTVIFPVGEILQAKV